jgi:hypothetical protein
MSGRSGSGVVRFSRSSQTLCKLRWEVPINVDAPMTFERRSILMIAGIASCGAAAALCYATVAALRELSMSAVELSFGVLAVPGAIYGLLRLGVSLIGNALRD